MHFWATCVELFFYKLCLCTIMQGLFLACKFLRWIWGSYQANVKIFKLCYYVETANCRWDFSDIAILYRGFRKQSNHKKHMKTKLLGSFLEKISNVNWHSVIFNHQEFCFSSLHITEISKIGLVDPRLPNMIRVIICEEEILHRERWWRKNLTYI